MFRTLNAHLQEDTIVYMQRIVVSLSMRAHGGQSVHSLGENSLTLCTDRPPRNLVESDSTIRCMYTMNPPEDEHLRLETHIGIIFYK